MPGQLAHDLLVTLLPPTPILLMCVDMHHHVQLYVAPEGPNLGPCT